MPQRNKRAVAYLRVSGRGQIDGDGFPRQEEAIRQWARSNSVEVVDWYREEGISGTIAERPMLAKLLLDLDQNHLDVELVVVEKLDRLARELFIQESVIRDLMKLGRELTSATEGADLLSGDPSRKLVRQIMGAVGEYDKTLTVQKLRAARVRKKERDGRCEGQKPYGELPGEQEVLARMKQLRRLRHGKRLGWYQIAKRLNAEGLCTRTGKAWRHTTVRRIIERNFPGMA